MRILRTPDDRFVKLPGWNFEPCYVDVADGDGGTLRVHYVDEGDRDAPLVLLLHGEPTWSYLYRKMIPVLAAAGLRAVAVDHIGFGRSDKPADREVYTYQRHVDWMAAALFGALDLRGATLFGQDWGGLIGLRLLAQEPERFTAVVAANTFLPTGDRDPGPAFLQWQRFSQETRTFPVGRIVNGGCTGELPDDVVAAYDAPFPGEEFKAGVRQFPMLVPTRPDDPAADANRRAWEVLRSWRKPFLCAFSDGDPITRGGERVFRELVPGAASVQHRTIEGAGHFLQEDKGEEVAQVVVDFVRDMV